jgi:hypothetical protein
MKVHARGAGRLRSQPPVPLTLRRLLYRSLAIRPSRKKAEEILSGVARTVPWGIEASGSPDDEEGVLMNRKLITVGMALAAVAALVLPGTASAANDPQLTDAGTLVPTGASIAGTIVNPSLTTTSGTSILNCSTAKATGKVLKNSGGTVEGEITTATYSGTGAVSADNSLPECTGSFGNSYITVTNTPLCIKSTPTMAEDEGQVGGGGCGTFGTVKFTIGTTTAGECKYETTSTLKGDFTTGGTETKLTIRNTQAGSGVKLISGGFLCPTSGMLTGSAGLETTGGTKLTIS